MNSEMTEMFLGFFANLEIYDFFKKIHSKKNTNEKENPGDFLCISKNLLSYNFLKVLALS